MPRVRAYGADATLKIGRETTYGVAATTGYRALPFRSADLSSEQPLGDDPLLGFGRNVQDPYRGLVTDEGKIDIPLDVRALGFWLHGLFGAASVSTVKATGYFAFSAQPAPNSTLTLNGVTWTFVTSGATGNQTNIGANLSATLTALASNLNGSANTEIAKCTYAADTTAGRLNIEFNTAGTSGNTWTLAASSTSNATPSYWTLTGGGYRHQYLSGGDAIPSHTVEVGHPQLVTPVFFRHLGTVMDSFSFEMGQEGPANASVTMVAQGEERATSTIASSPTSYTLQRYSQGRGSIKRGGVLLAGVTGGNLTFSNNIERVRAIRDDGKIQAADPTIATCQGAITVRFDGGTLVAEASSGDPIALEYGFTTADGWSLTFELFRVFLPKPKYAVSGPGGVEASFDWRAAYDAGAGTMLRVRLVNDVSGYN